jgi:hypothetical protein
MSADPASVADHSFLSEYPFALADDGQSDL